MSFAIGRGEIYGLIGPNGAGKTTLFNVLTGHLPPGRGHHPLRGRARSPTPRPTASPRLGIARTFQNIRLFANLSALENVMIGRHVRTRAGVVGAILRDRAHARRGSARSSSRARELLDYVGIAQRGNELAKHLSYGDQRRLEIARALATEPQLLALDEPAAGMNATEKRGAAQAARVDPRATASRCCSSSTTCSLVMGLCDRVLVLDYGRKHRRGRAARRSSATRA